MIPEHPCTSRPAVHSPIAGKLLRGATGLILLTQTGGSDERHWRAGSLARAGTPGPAHSRFSHPEPAPNGTVLAAGPVSHPSLP
jgi:hypothetical protein